MIHLPPVKRTFLPPDFDIQSKDDLIPYYNQLLSYPTDSVEALKKLLKDLNELEASISQNLAWKYIKMTCNTSDKESEQAYLFFITHIQPEVSKREFEVYSYLIQSPFIKELANSSTAYAMYLRSIQSSVDLFCEENIELETQEHALAQEYASIMGGIEINWEGKTMTAQQVSVFLKDPNRNIREKAYLAIQNARFAHKDQLNSLFSKLVSIRNQIAHNAGFDHYRDYKFKALGRFDYSVQDCLDFHDSIEKQVVPLKKKLLQERQSLMKLEVLKPWDTSVDVFNRPRLKPFSDSDELVHKTIEAFSRLDPYFGDCIKTMKAMGHLDLDSRLGKAPGGYNYPLAEVGVPFIFMNASGLHRDLETMIHEGGHAIHSFLSHSLELNAFKSTPSEVAELASMAMELLSMEVWDTFYSPDDVKRAKIEQLEGIVFTLPWIATVDAFQHWIYSHPNHTTEEREQAWMDLLKRFDTDCVDYSGQEHFKAASWHAQLHIFEVPFYYIEYGFAQLAALGIWKYFCSDPKGAIEDYKTALKLGYTESIPQIYESAGVRFDFSNAYIQNLFSFLWHSLSELKQN